MNRRMENLKVGDMITSSTPEEMKALALKLATCGTMDAEIIFQSMHPELGHVKYKVDTDYFATE